MQERTDPNIGDPERAAQQRTVRHFTEQLGYAYLGNWEAREGNSNIEVEQLRAWLVARGTEADIADAAIRKLRQAADNTSRSH
jgi:type I restriction enzyme R subunit